MHNYLQALGSKPSTEPLVQPSTQATRLRLLAAIESVQPPQKIINTPQAAASQTMRRCFSTSHLTGLNTAIDYVPIIINSTHSKQIIHGRFWPTAAPPQGVMSIVHGMGEHSGCYDDLAKALNKQGFHVIGFDHRGHGFSQGSKSTLSFLLESKVSRNSLTFFLGPEKSSQLISFLFKSRGVLTDYDQLHHDLKDYMQFTHSMFPTLPQSLYAHSMGGGLVLDHLHRYQEAPYLQNLAKVIITSPWIVLKNPPPKYMHAGALSLDYLGYNRVHGVENSVPPNPNRRPKIDPICHSKIANKWLLGAHYAGLRTQSVNQPLPQHLKSKLLLIHPVDDQITAPEATQAYAQAAALTPAQILSPTNGFGHSPHVSYIKDQYFGILKAHFPLELQPKEVHNTAPLEKV